MAEHKGCSLGAGSDTDAELGNTVDGDVLVVRSEGLLISILGCDREGTCRKAGSC